MLLAEEQARYSQSHKEAAVIVTLVAPRWALCRREGALLRKRTSLRSAPPAPPATAPQSRPAAGAAAGYHPYPTRAAAGPPPRPQSPHSPRAPAPDRRRSRPPLAPHPQPARAGARNENVVKIWSCGGNARVRRPSQPSPGAATESRIGLASPPLAANRADAAAPRRQRKCHVTAIIKAPYDNGQSFYQLTAHNRGRCAPCPALRVSPIFFIRKAVVRRRYAILPIWVNSR